MNVIYVFEDTLLFFLCFLLQIIDLYWSAISLFFLFSFVLFSYFLLYEYSSVSSLSWLRSYRLFLIVLVAVRHCQFELFLDLLERFLCLLESQGLLVLLLVFFGCLLWLNVSIVVLVRYDWNLLLTRYKIWLILTRRQLIMHLPCLVINISGLYN